MKKIIILLIGLLNFFDSHSQYFVQARIASLASVRSNCNPPCLDQGYMDISFENLALDPYSNTAGTIYTISNQSTYSNTLLNSSYQSCVSCRSANGSLDKYLESFNPGSWTNFNQWRNGGTRLSLDILYTPRRADIPGIVGNPPSSFYCTGNVITITTTGYYSGLDKSYIFVAKDSVSGVSETFTWSGKTGTPTWNYTIPGFNSTSNSRWVTVSIAGADLKGSASPPLPLNFSSAAPIVSVVPFPPTCSYTTDASFQVSFSGAYGQVGGPDSYSLSLGYKNSNCGNGFCKLDFAPSFNSTSFFNQTYQISSNSISGGSLPPGNYTIQAKNYYNAYGNVCFKEYDFTIPGISNVLISSATPVPVANVGGTEYHINCPGGQGGVNVIASGGNGGPYVPEYPSYSAGNSVSVKAKDSKGCVSSNSVQVSLVQPNPLLASYALLTQNGFNISCNGRNDAQLSGTVSNAIPPYRHQLLLGNVPIASYTSSTSSISFLNLSVTGLNKYKVFTTDRFNCSTVSSADFVVTEPPIFSLTGYSLSSRGGYTNSCYGTNDGIVTVTVVGGAGSRKLSSIFPATNSGFVASDMVRLGGLAPGSQQLNIQDGNGCSIVQIVTLTSPPAILSTVSVTNFSCYDSQDGGISILATGGAGFYSLAFGNSTSLSFSTITTNGVTTFSYPFVNNSSNTYFYRIKDKNGCEISSSPLLATITIPSLLTVSGASFTIPCKDGALSSIAGMVGGGTPPYKYTWTQGFSTTNLGQYFVPNARAGTYVASVTDKNNCTNGAGFPLQMTLTASEPKNKLNFVSSAVPVDCYGFSSGMVVLQASGGWGGFNYGLTKSVINSPISNFATISGLAVGPKKYFIKDINGCIDSTLATVTQPNPLLVSISTLTNISCFDAKNGVTVLSATGGNTTYTYTLTPASLTAQNFNSAIISGLDAISYSATATDEKNCPANTVSFTLTQPSPLIAGGKSTDASCGLPTGTAVITASGGVFPYAFQWSRNGSVTGFVTSSIVGIYSGFYTANVIDANQCITPTNIFVNDLSGPTVTGTVLKGTVCWYDRTGTATASAVAFGVKSITGFSWFGTLLANTSIGGLKGDTIYYVGARDSEGCFSSDSVYVPGPAKGQFSFIKADPTCHDGASGLLAITNIGGSPPYTNYLYTNTSKRTLADSLVSVRSTSKESVFRNLTGFSPLNSYRNYRYAFTDSKGCGSDTLYVSLYNPPGFGVRFPSDSSEVCIGTTVTLDAGNPGKSFRWGSADNQFSASTQKVSLQQAGKYSVTVSDAKGCTASGTFLLKTTNGYPGARFLVAPEVYVGDTVLLAEISWPFPDTVSWSWPSGIVRVDSGLGNVSIKASRVGTYAITMRAQQGICRATQTKLVRAIPNPTRKAETVYLGLKAVNIYPNPSNGGLTVTADLGDVSDILVEVFDGLKSQPLYSWSGEGQSWYERSMDLSGLPAGVYLVRVSAGESVRVVKWVKL